MNEKEKIFHLVKEGQITIEEALVLLEKTSQPTQQADASASLNVDEDTTESSEPVKSKRKMFKVDVLSKDGAKVKVNVPVSLMKVALRIGKDIDFKDNPLRNAEINLDEIIQAVDEDLQGDIVTINSSDHDTVRVYID